jgi:hypothetical protein
MWTNDVLLMLQNNKNTQRLKEKSYFVEKVLILR